MKNKRMPEVRFAGVIGDWEKRKLAEVAHYSNGGSFENEIVNNGKYELITLKSVDIDGNLVSSNKFIDSEVSTLEKDTLVMILSEQAPGLLGKTSVIPFNNYYVLNQRVASLTPKEEADSNFLTKAINRNGKYFSSRGAGTKVQNISKPNVENFELFIPEFKEQIKIGNFFKQLDEIIALHQQELTTLKQTKQGFLQKMFPKEGESVPEFRFPGFSEDWEERMLGEVLIVNSGRDYKHLQYGDIPVYGTGGYMLNVNDKLSDNDAIGIGRKGTINKPQFLKGPFWTVDTLFYMTIKEENDLLFFYSLANKIQWKKYDESTGVPSLSKASIDKIPICFPTPQEQSIIGDFFKRIDDTIALHQNELEALKETKKAFLQKMFI
ncbi:restriction endonuclease subunit S [Sutcliffiella rhizosphaerae]|uniref:Type I restriction modification DNA specificity domain-containing protein n=1 Tax=Sutcliffiella rhizosphaerae TaxID=2880967 RepID=A0ABN8AC44_9BACI|nr:restriction endonuclease subunit S [Sutcliffiella rhizosphaerae]CAG9622798.1 hypothetical protein BACCIP111883_03589 [Sutcliffiella rhizosphaerae]